MGTSESGSTSSHAAVGDVLTTERLSSEENRPRPHPQVWAIALAAGVVVGLVSWLAGELAHGAFQPRLFKVEVVGMTSLQPTLQSRNAADLKNASLAFAILGCVTGLVMGLGGGLAGRSPSRGLFVGLGAQALGGLLGALASLALVPLFYRQLVPDPNDLLSPILIHAGIWMTIAAVGGLAFAIGMGCRERVPHAIGGACLGALLATVVFHLLSGALFPDSGSTDPVATSSIVRLLARVLVAVLFAVGAARGALGRVPLPRSIARDVSMK